MPGKSAPDMLQEKGYDITGSSDRHHVVEWVTQLNLVNLKDKLARIGQYES
jgi:hypothetical protein